jgi:predicted patatin/cPLA2 family phospholipase
VIILLFPDFCKELRSAQLFFGVLECKFAQKSTFQKILKTFLLSDIGFFTQKCYIALKELGGRAQPVPRCQGVCNDKQGEEATYMKIGLIMEGGAMRGMFTAGVIDVLMENGISFEGAVGVSAGAVFGCNYKSNQPGRAIRYNTTYCKDRRYAGMHNLMHTGNLYSEQFCYHEIPEHLDPFDAETFRNSPMEFYAVCTDVQTGDPVYHKCVNGDSKDLEWLRASASMPLVSRIVKVDGYSLLDGGIADSIPVHFFESIGYERNVIVLTQPKGFVKKKNKMLPAMKAAMFRYPAFLAAAADRHERYNETLGYVSMLEESGKALVIRPPIPLEIGAMERDPAELRRVYDTGRAVAAMHLPRIRAFMEAAREMA